MHDSTSTSIPTRLLDLNAHDTTDGIRLIETKEHNLELPVHYAALSYCWGPPEDAATQFTTKGNTLNQRKREIPFSAMSRVMQDAVTVTRSLGFRYIWIDAVCIIQDNREDWEKEAEHMGAIYFNAFVTVVALASSSCHQGFLERTTGLPIPFTSSIDYSIQGTLQLKHVTFRGMNLLKSLGWRTSDIDLSFSAWPTRAWTVQEMELSPRLIYFGPSRVWFSCVEREVVEPFTLTHNSNDKRSQPRLATDLLLFTSEDMELLYDEWLALLDNFCFRKITKRSDRFPAISGMAKRIAEALDDVYLAGLWKGDFARGLLFIWVSEAQKLEQHVDLVAPPPVSGDEYLAPTWSPLVVTGHVEYRKCADFFSECEIVDAIITHVSQFNVFGQISRAEVRVRGHALLLPCDLEKEAHATRQFRNQWWIGSIREGCRIMCRLDWQSKVVVEILRGKLVLLFVGSYLADEEDWDGEGYSGGNRDAVGIILFPENEAEKRYYRVGWFECLVGDGGKDMLERWEYSTLTLV